MTDRPIMAIDPGASGGIAWRDGSFPADASPMPDTISGLARVIYEAKRIGASVIIEHVGTYRPGNSGPAAVKFARHCGQIEGICSGFGIPFSTVMPSKWMAVIPGVPKGESAKTERKRMIRDAMGRRYPHLRVTLKTADALGILTWAMERT